MDRSDPGEGLLMGDHLTCRTKRDKASPANNELRSMEINVAGKDVEYVRGVCE